MPSIWNGGLPSGNSSSTVSSAPAGHSGGGHH
jgi:hypothetical protein